MVALTFMIILVVHVSTSLSETKALPRGLILLLEKMGVPVENYLNIAMPDSNPAISSTQYDDSTRLQDSSDFPEHSSGVNTTMTINVPGFPSLTEANCSPRPTAIEVPKDPGYLNWPPTVLLHRCTGGCGLAQNTHHCAVTRRNELNINVFKIHHRLSHWASVTVYNHTACACDCIKKESDCDLVKHKWNQNSCSCLCRHDGSQCNLEIERWNTATCECVCKEASSHCDHHKKEWDPTRCGCYCKKAEQNLCQSQNLNIDPGTCDCVVSDFEIF